MIDKDKIFISFSDIYQYMKRDRRKIFLIFLILSLFYFLYSLFKPITYTAEGLFKTPPPPSSMWLDLLTKDEKEASSDDNPRLLLNSYAVTSLVVKKLHLQGHIELSNSSFFLNRIWQNLYLERSFAAMSSHERPKSEILAKGVLVPKTALNFLKPPSLYFSELTYEGAIQKQFLVHFIDETHFTVSNSKKQNIGSGDLDKPFYFDDGHFVISGKPTKRKTKIHVIPLASAAQSIARNLKVQKNKKQPALLHVSYKSKNLELAVNIVNTLMECYQEHIKQHAAQKVQSQVHYLNDRKQVALSELEQLMNDQTQSRKEFVHEGGYMQLDKEAAFLMNKKAEFTKQLLDLKIQIEKTATLILQDIPQPFEAILKTASTFEMCEWQLLALDTLRELIYEHLKLLDQWELEKIQFINCLENLAHPQSDLESIAKTVQEESLHSMIREIQTLHNRLHDGKNWSQRERDIFQGELALKKELFCKELESLKEGRSIQIGVFRKRLKSMHEAYFVRLCDEYEKIFHTLEELKQKELSFPEKWMKEETLSLHAKMAQGMIEQISKAMEVKNISAQVASAESYPFQNALYPTLPHPPYILLGSLIAGFCGTFGYIFYLLCDQVRRGPTASFKNLAHFNLPVIGEAHLHPPKEFAKCDSIDQKCFKNLSHKLSKSPIIFLSCKENTSFWITFCKLMKTRNERIALIHFSENVIIKDQDTYAYVMNPLYFEEQLSSAPFTTFLEDLKMRYDQIFLIHAGSFPIYLPKFISDVVLFVTSEMLHQLPDAFFVSLRKNVKKEKEVRLQDIKPLLDALQTKMHSLKDQLQNKLKG